MSVPPPPPGSDSPYPPPYGSDSPLPPPVGAYGAPPPGAYGAPPPGAYGAPPPYGGYPAAYGGGYPPPYPGGPFGVDAYGRPLSDKSKLVAGLLQLFLGCFGVGRFYLGYNGIAIAQIAVSFLTCGIGAIWPFVDGILILVGKVPDVGGRPLRE